MGKASRAKGARGELAAREPLRQLTGREWERSARQSRARGGEGCPDLVPADGSRPPLHPEVKVGRAPRVLSGLAQAEADAAIGVVPVVLVHRDREEWAICLRVLDFWRLVEALGGTRPEGLWERSARQSRARGGEGCPDLVPAHGGPPPLHPEVKVGKAPRVLSGLAQAEEDAAIGVVPIVLVHRDREDWAICLRVYDFWRLVEALGGTRPEGR